MAEITLSKVVAYLFGVAAALAGLLCMLLGLFINGLFFAGGLALLVAGLLAMPAVRSTVQGATGVGFSRGATVALVVLLTLASLGGVTIGLLTAGDDGPTGPGSDVSNVSVQASDAAPDDSTHALAVAWNARAQSAVDPNPSDMSIYSADEGQKYLVVRVQLTNTGNESIDMTPRLFRVVVDGVEHDHQALFGSSQGGLSQVTLRPDASYDGWVTFSVPSSTTSAELIATQDAYVGGVAVDFTQDESLPINVSA